VTADRVPFDKQAEKNQELWRKAQNIFLGQNGSQNGKIRVYILPSDK
jgi:hypothetical protein